MKKFILLIIVILSKCLFAQKPFEFDRSLVLREMNTSTINYKYGCSEGLITNRDYITYILWKIKVYGSDYPENSFIAFPGYDNINEYYKQHILEEYYNSTAPIHYMLNNSDWFVKDYMFNAKFIDFPVIGISKQQASRFNQWLSDRYNEWLLIEKGFQKINMYQLNEDNFVTDSYLANQYYGRSILDSFIVWKDEVLLNNFRLPTKKEVGQIKVMLKKQPRTKLFLKSFQDSLFEVNRDGIEIKLKYPSVDKKFKNFITKPNVVFKAKSVYVSEMFLSDSANSYIEAFKENGYPVMPDSSFRDSDGYNFEKDSIGFMNYVIIGRDANNKKILITEDGYTKMADYYIHPDKEFMVFRYSVTIKH